ncbi:MAG: hypothetical protein FJ090_19760 [Deltaproteobacteria bacterium]|nr:hypothetical protein [Deltaproteobacteria bacterium]
MGPAPRVEAIPSASFLPREPETWEEAGLEIALVEQIVLRLLRHPDGRKIPAPFDPLLAFSTNIDPATLVDEAFLHRVPCKAKEPDPTRDEFAQVVTRLASAMNVGLPPGSVSYLLDRHYRSRPMRFCHARDLVQQLVDHAKHMQTEALATPEAWDRAVANYFGVTSST